MISLIFDTETTGFPLWKSPPSHPDQPGLVELAFELWDHERGEPMMMYSAIVDSGIEISEGAMAVHGISDEVVKRIGMRDGLVLMCFIDAVNVADRIVCHNVKFDLLIMQVAIVRHGIAFPELDKIDKYCTMEAATPVLKLPCKNGRKHKWPKLDEAYRALVDPEGFSGAHRAYNDVEACRKVMLALEHKVLHEECPEYNSEFLAVQPELEPLNNKNSEGI